MNVVVNGGEGRGECGSEWRGGMNVVVNGGEG